MQKLDIMGLGNGMSGAPNIAAIMNSLPSKERGVVSGKRAMLQKSGMVASIAMFFTIVIVSLIRLFPQVLAASLTDIGASKHIGPMSVIPRPGLCSQHPWAIILSMPFSRQYHSQ